mmetsp:Transcript_7448/g.14570  ORF Transcript_7448/g.14570 Transcript_7448/m.14570 type:complete len:527 (+) Transcript_7448:120-1700(+)
MAPRVKVACHFCDAKVRRTETIPMGPSGATVCKDCANYHHGGGGGGHGKKDPATLKCAGCTKWTSAKGDIVQLQPCGCKLCKDCLIVFLSETRHLAAEEWKCWNCQQFVTTHSDSREADLRYLPPPDHGNGRKRGFPTTDAGRDQHKRTKRTPFEARLQALLEFKEKYGHCKVEEKRSKNKIVKANSPEEDLLGSWCSHVRCGRITINDEQRRQLDEIGFHWEKKNERVVREWHEMFDRLAAYKDRFGDTYVPFEWEEDKKLAEWVNTQRKYFSKGKMKDDRKEKLDSIGFAWQGLKGARKKNSPRKVAPLPLPVEETMHHHQHEDDVFDGMPFQQMNMTRGNTGAPLPDGTNNNQQNFNDNALLARLNSERGNFPNGMPHTHQTNFNDNAMFARINAQRNAPSGGEMMNNQGMMNNPHQGVMNNQGIINNQGNFNDNAILNRLNAERGGPMGGGGGMPNNQPGFNDNSVLARLNTERLGGGPPTQLPPPPGDMMNNQPGFNENQVDRYAYQHLLQFTRPGARFYG